MKKKQLIHIPSDIGAGKFGTALALDALRVADAMSDSPSFLGSTVETYAHLNEQRGEPGKYEEAKYLDALIAVNKKTAEGISQTLKKNVLPVVVSGDHSNAIGVMGGLRSAYSDERIGVIWIDAHADLHTPFTTPSGNLHGMSLAASLGQDNKELARHELSAELIEKWNILKGIGSSAGKPKINPEDVFFIGLRDFEIQEYHIIRDYQLKHYSPYDFRKKGKELFWEEVLAFTNRFDRLYISFDVDVLDVSVSVGTGTPVYNGLLPDEAHWLTDQLLGLPNLSLWEFTEINPLLDNANAMANFVVHLLRKVMKA